MISGRNPGDQESFMRSIGAFDGDLVNWLRTPGFKSRFYCPTTHAPIDAIRAEIRAGRPVLANVYLGSGAPKPNHWVLIVDEQFTIHDPWYNEVAPITKHYGINAETAILGGAYFNPQTSLSDPSMDISTLKDFAHSPIRINGTDTISVRLDLPNPETAAQIGVDLDQTKVVENIPGILATDAVDMNNWGRQVQAERDQAIQERNLAQEQVKALTDQIANTPVTPPESSKNLEDIIVLFVNRIKALFTNQK